jgi:hypothetical protein
MQSRFKFGLLVAAMLAAITGLLVGSRSRPAPVAELPSPVLDRAAPSSSEAGGDRLSAVTPAEDPTLLRLREVAQQAASAEPERGESAWAEAVESIRATEFPQLAAQLATVEDGTLSELRWRLVRRWAMTDPAAAAGWATSLPNPEVRNDLMQHLAVAWSESHLEEALAWGRQLPEGSEKTAVSLILGYEAARTEPVEALKLGVALPPGNDRDALLVHSASQWAGTDPTAAGDWAAEIPDAVLRHQLVAAIATAWADTDPQAAAVFALNHLPPGQEQDRAVVSVVQRWTEAAPTGAASWVEAFPAVPARDSALQNLVALWAQQESAAPGDWLNHLPPSPLRELGESFYSQALTNLALVMTPSSP